MCDKQRPRPACAYAHSDQSHCYSLKYSMVIKLLTAHNLEFLSLKGGCAGLSESSLSKYHIVGNHMSWLKYIFMIGLPIPNGDRHASEIAYFAVDLAKLIHHLDFTKSAGGQKLQLLIGISTGTNM